MQYMLQKEHNLEQTQQDIILVQEVVPLWPDRMSSRCEWVKHQKTIQYM